MEQALNKEDSVSLRGFIKEEPRSVGGYEMGVSEIKIINPVSNEFPISPKEHGADFLMSTDIYGLGQKTKCNNENST